MTVLTMNEYLWLYEVYNLESVRGKFAIYDVSKEALLQGFALSVDREFPAWNFSVSPEHFQCVEEFSIDGAQEWNFHELLKMR